MDNKNTLQDAINKDITFNANGAETAQTIKILRALSGKALLNLEEITEISYQQIRKYETNKTKMNIDKLKKIFDALGYNLTLTVSKKS